MKVTYEGDGIEVEMERVESDDDSGHTYFEILIEDEAGHCAGDMTIDNLEQLYSLRDALNLFIVAVEMTES